MMHFLRRVVWQLTSSRTPTEIERQQRDASFIKESLKAALPAWGDGVSRLPLDGTYYCPDRDGFDVLREERGAEWLPYTKAQFDCEDFAALFRAIATRDYGVNAVGVVVDWSAEPAHSYNAIVLADGSVLLYEPQDDRVIEPAELPADDTHRLEHGRILI